MDKNKSSTMIKFKLFKMLDMSAVPKHVGVSMNSVCMRIRILFTDYLFMNQTKKGCNTKKDSNKEHYRRLNQN